MRTRLPRVLLAALLYVAVPAGCGYGPEPKSGALQCGPSASCPEGYGCADGYCWRPGARQLLGTWSFVSPSTRQIVCDGVPDAPEDWASTGESFDVVSGTTGVFGTHYYCDWELDLASNGSSTAIQPGQHCSAADMLDPTIMYTWHGETFALSTSDGQTGTLDASLPYDYVTLTSSGSCTMHFTGTMNKN
jgi:hypothetical protein